MEKGNDWIEWGRNTFLKKLIFVLTEGIKNIRFSFSKNFEVIQPHPLYRSWGVTSTAVKRLGQVSVLFREILFTMNRKHEQGCITIAVECKCIPIFLT